MTRRPTKADEMAGSGAAMPTPQQLTAFKMARICLIELEALYTDILEEDRHDWALHPERHAWLTAEVTRLREQRKSLNANDHDTNIQIVRACRAMLGAL
jgi:hypothetical protein